VFDKLIIESLKSIQLKITKKKNPINYFIFPRFNDNNSLIVIINCSNISNELSREHLRTRGNLKETVRMNKIIVPIRIIKLNYCKPIIFDF